MSWRKGLPRHLAIVCAEQVMFYVANEQKLIKLSKVIRALSPGIREGTNYLSSALTAALAGPGITDAAEIMKACSTLETADPKEFLELSQCFRRATANILDTEEHVLLIEIIGLSAHLMEPDTRRSAYLLVSDVVREHGLYEDPAHASSLLEASVRLLLSDVREQPHLHMEAVTGIAADLHTNFAAVAEKFAYFLDEEYRREMKVA